jgi:6-phosphogluconolactonase
MMASLCILVGGLAPDASVASFSSAAGAPPVPLQAFAAFGPSPSYLALSPSGAHAYAANHDIPSPGVTPVALTWGPSGCLAAAAALQPLVPAPDPCHVAVHPSGSWLFSASYSGGSVSVFPILPGGLLGPPNTTALGKNAHQTAFWFSGSEVLVPLLGSDAVAVLSFDAASGALALRQMLALPPGSGPRHLVMHPSNFSRAYLVLELSSSVAQLHRGGGGAWEVLGAPASTLRAGLPPAALQAAAAIALSPDARFLYVSNRASPQGAGDNSIAAFALDEGGALRSGGPVSWATGGPGEQQELFFPRDFALSPSGDALVAVSQRAGTVTLFARDAATGALQFVSTTPSAPLGTPTYVHLRALA